MREPFAIREEAPADAGRIADITAAAFLAHVHSSHTEPLIVAGLRRSGALVLSLVAEMEGGLVGHIAFSPVTISDGSSGWYGLGPVSVEPPQQRRGIGQALVRKGLAILRERGAGGCVVLGSPGYYGRFGFAATPDLTLAGPPPELFMSLHFMGPWPHGEVVYHDAFGICA